MMDKRKTNNALGAYFLYRAFRKKPKATGGSLLGSGFIIFIVVFLFQGAEEPGLAFLKTIGILLIPGVIGFAFGLLIRLLRALFSRKQKPV